VSGNGEKMCIAVRSGLEYGSERCFRQKVEYIEEGKVLHLYRVEESRT